MIRFIKTLWLELCIVAVGTTVLICILTSVITEKQTDTYDKAHTATIVDIDTGEVIVQEEFVYKIWQDGGEVTLYIIRERSGNKTMKRFWFGSKNIRIDW